MKEDYLNALLRSRAKLVEQRRALAKRNCMSDRNEGYAERIVAIQAAIEATDRAIDDEESPSAGSEPGAESVAGDPPLVSA